MNRTYRILPCYTGDVSGAASALYEMGGMVVIHDPSGCNSTYNTHDENRWYENDSLIFISGLSQREAIFGDDRKFIEDIVDAAEKLKPKFIALVSSPIPYMNGTDFNAIAHSVQDKTGILTFKVQTNGMHDYTVGAGNALEAAAKYLVPDMCLREDDIYEPEKTKQLSLSKGNPTDIMQNDPEKIKQLSLSKGNPADIMQNDPENRESVRVNILGLTPLDFTAEAALTIKNKLTESGFEIVSSWSYGCDLEDIQNSPHADVNLVVSVTGYKAAAALKEKYGIPFVCGCPTGCFGNIVFDMMRKSAVDRVDRIAYKNGFITELDGSIEKNYEYKKHIESNKNYESNTDCEHNKDDKNNTDYSVDSDSAVIRENRDNEEYAVNRHEKRIVLVGEPVTMSSLAKALELEYGVDTKVVCSLELKTLHATDLLRDEDILCDGEEEIEAAIAGEYFVIADSMIKPVLPESVNLFGLPHLAFSGREFLWKKDHVRDIFNIWTDPEFEDFFNMR